MNKDSAGVLCLVTASSDYAFIPFCYSTVAVQKSESRDQRNLSTGILPLLIFREVSLEVI